MWIPEDQTARNGQEQLQGNMLGSSHEPLSHSRVPPSYRVRAQLIHCPGILSAENRNLNCSKQLEFGSFKLYKVKIDLPSNRQAEVDEPQGDHF